MASFASRRPVLESDTSVGGSGHMVGSGRDRPVNSRRLHTHGIRLVIMAALALLVLAIGGCAPGRERADQRAEQGGHSSSERPASPAEVTQAAAPSASLEEHETPEAALVRLSAMWDDAFARRDEALLRKVFHPGYTGIEAEIANMNSPANKGTPTPVSEISIESEEPGRVVLSAVFEYDEGPVRQRILLLGDGPNRKIAGVQDVEE